ncbi:hypothetical protein THAOC_25044, partial [Thalassiosira oceanica]
MIIWALGRTCMGAVSSPGVAEPDSGQSLVQSCFGARRQASPSALPGVVSKWRVGPKRSGSVLLGAVAVPELFCHQGAREANPENHKRYQIKRTMNWPRQLLGRITGFLLYEGGEVAEELRGNLKRVRIGALVTEISNEAFRGCKKLEEVQFNGGTTIIGEGAFQECTALRSVTIPSTVTELGKRAFFGCHNLAQVQLNEGLQFLGDSVFHGCTALRSVTIPSTVTKL